MNQERRVGGTVTRNQSLVGSAYGSMARRDELDGSWSYRQSREGVPLPVPLPCLGSPHQATSTRFQAVPPSLGQAAARSTQLHDEVAALKSRRLSFTVERLRRTAQILLGPICTDCTACYLHYSSAHELKLHAQAVYRTPNTTLDATA
jgi:hypothetical protein